MAALYKRRMFRLTLVASRSLLSVAMAAICLSFAANLIEPMRAFVEGRLGLEEDWAIMRWPWPLPVCWCWPTF